MGTRWIAWLFGFAALSGSAVVVSSALPSSPVLIDRLPDVGELTPTVERTSIRFDAKDIVPSLPLDRAADPQNSAKKVPVLSDRLKIPAELPGAEAPSIQLPRPDPDHPQAYDEALKRLYPPLPAIGDNLHPQVTAEGKGLSLRELEQMARASNPILQQAAADIRAAQGSFIQAGVLPNPTVGFAADSVRQNRTPGQVGGYVSQEFVLLAKIRLARAVAAADRELAQLAFVQIEAEVLAGVRSGYYAVLAAHETMRIQQALTRFTDEVYRVQVDQVKGGQAAPYEPLQLRVLAFQARGQLVQARNRYVSAWKQLAAVLGHPDLPPTLLVGQIDQPLPLLRHDLLLGTILANHSDVRSARQKVERAQSALRLAEVNRLPNVTVNTTMQKDYTEGLNNTIYNVDVGVPLPIFNRNQGNIVRARAELERAHAESSRVRNELSAELATAFERYDNQRRLVVYYRDHIVPDQVRAYRGVYGRHQQDPDRASFGDIINAQQTLAGTLTAYLQSLRDAWSAVVDIAKLMQTGDLSSLADETCSTSPGCLPGGCHGLFEGLPWPEAMPTPPPPIARRTPALGSVPGNHTAPDTMPALQVPALRDSANDCPCGPGQGPDAVFSSPVGPLERSTKRRKFFTWPLRRTDGEPPQMLPRADEIQPCRPSEAQAPSNGKAPTRLPVAAPTGGETIYVDPGPALPAKSEVTHPPQFESTAPPKAQVPPGAQAPLGPIEAPRSGSPDTKPAPAPQPDRLNRQIQDYPGIESRIPRSLSEAGMPPRRASTTPRALPLSKDSGLPGPPSPPATLPWEAPPAIQGETVYVLPPPPPPPGAKEDMSATPSQPRAEPYRTYPQGVVPSLKLTPASRVIMVPRPR